MSNEMRIRARTAAPLATVRAALTDPAALEVWLAEHAEVDLPHTFTFWGRHTPDRAAPWSPTPPRSRSSARSGRWPSPTSSTPSKAARPPPKCDFAQVETFRASVTVGAAPEDVHASLTDPERFRRWFLATMSVEPHAGGRWAMGEDFTDENPTARIVDLRPGRRVELDWGGMVSTWELAGAQGRTRLTFVNSGSDGVLVDELT